eukprot:1794737-Lingulodinium_polyedra.AAC.1
MPAASSAETPAASSGVVPKQKTMPKGGTFSAETRSMILGKPAPAGSTAPSTIESFNRWIVAP